MAGTLGSIGHNMLQLSKPGMRALWVVDELCHSFMGLPSSMVEVAKMKGLGRTLRKMANYSII